jgi:hypothetical protein
MGGDSSAESGDDETNRREEAAGAVAGRKPLAHGDAPFRMSVDEGVAVYEQGRHRLPILGLRALTNSKLQSLIYGQQQRAVIQSPRKWYWPL